MGERHPIPVAGPARRPLVLVADADLEHLSLVARALDDAAAIESCSSAEEAMALLQASEPDVVIADMHLPGLSGLDLLEHATQRDPHVGRVLLTHYGDTQTTLLAIDHRRVDAVVGKPCVAYQIRLTIQALVDRTRLLRDNAHLVRDLTAKNQALREAMNQLRSAQRRVIDAERLSAIGRMCASVAHDFRGPLTVLRGVASELRQPEVGRPELAELAAQLSEETGRMSRMCNELVDLTRSSAGTIELTETTLDDVVAMAVSVLLQDAMRVGVELETHLSTPGFLRVDVDRLRRALLNLGYNAIEAMPEGGTLRIATEFDGDEFRICVSDTGPGIPEHLRRRLFEPFFTVGKAGGTGLGLAVVKKIAEDHAGSVTLGKSEGGGAAFTLHLPGRLAVGTARAG